MCKVLGKRTVIVGILLLVDVRSAAWSFGVAQDPSAIHGPAGAAEMGRPSRVCRLPMS